MAWRESRRTVSSSFSVGDERISVLDLDYWTEERLLTGCLDKRRVVLLSQQRVGEIAEELLQQAGYTVDVVEEVFGVAEVEIAGTRIWTFLVSLGSTSNKARQVVSHTCVKESLELVHMGHGARKSVYAFEAKAEEVHSLDALINNHGNRQPISLI